MADSRKNGSKTGERTPDGKFGEGNPGRPKGSRHKTTLAVEALLEGEAEGLTRAAIDKALEGDTVAMRLCLERIAPVRKDTPIEFDLPPINSADDAKGAAEAVLKAVADGEITPMEGAAVMGLVDSYRRTVETVDFEARIKRLEAARNAT